VDQIQLLLDGTMEKTVSETHQFAQFERARMLYWFRDGTQVRYFGPSNKPWLIWVIADMEWQIYRALCWRED
jgi:hypothetical protein